MTGGKIVVGIDEAGYGPRLGPLVVALAAFHVPYDGDGLPGLAAALSDHPQPLCLDDSKTVYRGGAGLAALERSVLAFAGAAARAEAPDRPRETAPWGLPWPAAVPVAAPAEEIGAARERLGRTLEGSGIRVLALATRTIGVSEFNEGVRRHGTKARVLFDAAMDLLAPWLSEPGPAEVRVDRHGGRAYYAPLLAERFPERFPRVIRETPTDSAYRFRRPEGDMVVSFEVDGDLHHRETGLASMAAKYVRELHMKAFNAFFSAADPDLKPTAGYHGDADRWLSDSKPARERTGTAEADLLRLQ